MSHEDRFRPYHAPQASGSALIEPPLSRVAELFAQNTSLAWTGETWWSSLRQTARTQLLSDAVRYTSAYRSTDWVETRRRLNREGGETAIVMAGHQPELFHAGVWFKNFALDRVAATLGVIPINLIVDNDVAMRRSIRVPAIDPISGQVHPQIVAYDEGTVAVPYEQLLIEDRERFDRFDDAVQRCVAPWVSAPSVVPLWTHARSALERCGIAGCALAQARHALEGDLGLQTLEIPLSVAVRSISFAKFLLAILSELPRFQQCYNDAARDYRTAHGIRSTAHPVPNLAQDDGWFEAPLWLYGNQSPVRRSVWVRREDERLVISDRHGRECTIEQADSDAGAEQLLAAQGPEWKLRPRALLTTMYSRSILSDLFLHGIGGGKYDQLGDRISAAFFEIEPPQFMVMSATIRLPGVDAETTLLDRERDLRRQLRDSRFNPERVAAPGAIAPALLQRKRELLASIPEPGAKAAWHRELSELNQRMAATVAGLRSDLRRQLGRNRNRQAAQNVLASREHPFCLFPLDHLTESYERLLSSAL